MNTIDMRYLSLLAVLVSISGSAIAETCEPVYDQGKSCIAPGNRIWVDESGSDTSHWSWTFTNNCQKAYSVNAYTNGKFKKDSFQVDGGGKATASCYPQTGCTDFLGYDVDCYGSSGEPNRAAQAKPAPATKTNPALASAQQPQPTASPTASPMPSAAPPQPSAPLTRLHSQAACGFSNESCHNSYCFPTFGSQGAKNADALLACNESCTQQETACETTGNSLVDPRIAIAAGNAKVSGIPVDKNQTQTKKEKIKQEEESRQEIEQQRVQRLCYPRDCQRDCINWASHGAETDKWEASCRSSCTTQSEKCIRTGTTGLPPNSGKARNYATKEKQRAEQKERELGAWREERIRRKNEQLQREDDEARARQQQEEEQPQQ